MAQFSALMQNATATLVLGSGTLNGVVATAITEEEAGYLRANYSSVTVFETPDEAPKASKPDEAPKATKDEAKK